MKWLEYDGAFVFGSGIPSGVLRFVGHIVLGIYMSLASGTYKYVKAHAAVVQQPPFNPDTLYLSYLASKWVRTNLFLLRSSVFAFCFIFCKFCVLPSFLRRLIRCPFCSL